MTQPCHRAVRRLQPDTIQYQVRGRVVRYRDHQPHRITQRQSRSAGEVCAQQPRTRHRVIVGQLQTIVPVDPTPLDLTTHFHQHRQLDQAGRRHRTLGLPGETTPRIDVPDNDRHLALVTADQPLDHRSQPRIIRSRQHRRLAATGHDQQTTHKPPSHATSHVRSPSETSNSRIASKASSSSGTTAPGTRPSRSHSHNKSNSS